MTVTSYYTYQVSRDNEQPIVSLKLLLRLYATPGVSNPVPADPFCAARVQSL